MVALAVSVAPETETDVSTMFTDIIFVCDEDEPQALFAVTVILPLVAFAVVLIEVVVEEPIQPEGSVHV